jgi:predicted metalloprotease with PDZ domain
VDYAHLLGLAGYVMKPSRPDNAWIGNVPVSETQGGLAVGVSGGGRGGGGGRVSVVPFNTPLYAAGIDEGDVIVSIDDKPATTALWQDISNRKPGDKVTFAVRRHDGAMVTTTATLVADPAISIQSADANGGTLTDAQKAFRDAWLSSRVK